jgi:lysozyme
VTKRSRQPSRAVLDLIKRFEGFHPRAVRLADGRWMIGHSHTLSARDGASVSEADAEALLIYDLRQVAAAIGESVFSPLGQNQFDALASFAFNIGITNFQGSVVVRRINAGAMHEAAQALEIWRKAAFGDETIVVDALVRRRAVEKALFLTPDGEWIAAPSPEIEPLPDYGLIAVPAEEARGSFDLDQEELPSPIERAAANLAARLLVLAAEDEPRTEPDLESSQRAAAEMADIPREPIAEPQPPAMGDPETPPVWPEPSSGPAGPSEAEPAPLSEPSDSSTAAALEAEALRRRIYGLAEPRPRSKRERRRLLPLAALAAGGLLLFGGAVAWALRSGSAGDPPGTLNLGVVLVGVIGVLCVASGVYLILERLARRE